MKHEAKYCGSSQGVAFKAFKHRMYFFPANNTQVKKKKKFKLLIGHECFHRMQMSRSEKCHAFIFWIKVISCETFAQHTNTSTKYDVPFRTTTTTTTADKLSISVSQH